MDTARGEDGAEVHPDGSVDRGQPDVRAPDRWNGDNDLDLGSKPDFGRDMPPDQAGDATPFKEPLAFVVKGTLEAKKTSDVFEGMFAPPNHDFTLWIDPAGSFVLGGSGTATRIGFRSAGGGTFTATGQVDVGVASPYCGGLARAQYASFSVTIAGDKLTGTARGTLDAVVGDVVVRYDVTLTMTGTVDREGPSFGAGWMNADPLAGLFAAASEALPSATTARLESEGETVPLTPFVPMDSGVVSGFNKPGARALPYATTYQLKVLPGSDLVGNAAGLPLPKLVTAAAPPLVPEDGFESATGELAGGHVIEQGELPPIAGKRSLLVAAGNSGQLFMASRRFTARMAVQPGDKTVKVTLRSVSPFEFPGIYGSQLQAAVPGGAIEATPIPDNANTMLEKKAIGNATYYFGPVRTVTVNLPAGTQGEVVVDLTAGPQPPSCGLPPPPTGLLFDDLRIE